MRAESGDSNDSEFGMRNSELIVNFSFLIYIML